MTDRSHLEYLERQLGERHDRTVRRQNILMALFVAILAALVLYTGEGPTGEMVFIAALPMIVFLGCTCCEDTTAEDERMRDIYVEAVHLRHRLSL